MANFAQPQVVINYISQLKKYTVNRNNQPSQLIIQTDYNLNETYNFQIINKINQIVQLDSNTTYQLYGTYIDAKKQVHVLFYTLGVTPRDNTLSFLVNTYTTEYLNYVKNNRTPIDISIVAKQNVSGSTRSYMVLRDTALANPRGYIEGQAPTDIVYQNIFSSSIPVSTAFGAGNNLNLAQDLEGQEIYTFAFGENLSTNNANQFVIGSENVADATKAFIVANSGNIFTVDYEGNVETNSISATSIFINGEEVGTQVDEKLEALSSAVDDKISATEDWVSDTFETKESATQTFNELEGDIGQISAFVSGLPTDIAFKADQTDLDEANQKINTISGQVQYLSGVIDQNIEDIGQLNTAVGSKANQTDLEALSTQVQGKAEASELNNYVLTSTMSAYATSTWVDTNYAKKGDIPTDVYTKTEVDTAIVDATSGKADSSTVNGEFEATSAYIAQVSGNLQTAIENIPSTVYEAGFGLDLQNSNTFVLTAGVADLNGYSDLATKEFVISSLLSTVLSGKLSQFQNDVGYLTAEDISGEGEVSYTIVYSMLSSADTNTLTITKDDINHKIVLSAAAGGSGGEQYSAGTGLDLTNNTFSVDTEWLTGQIAAQVPSVEGLATETYVNAASANAVDVATAWVDGKNYLTAHQSLDAYATQQWVEDKHYLTGVDLTNYATISLVETTSGNITGWVEGKGYLTEVPNTYALKTDIPSNNDISGIASAVASTYVGELDIPTDLGDLTNNAGYAKSADVTTEIATATGVVTSWVEGKQYLTEIPASVSGDAITAANAYTDTVSTALNGKFSDYVTTTTLTNDYYNKTEADEKFLTAHQDLTAYAEKTWVEGNFLSSTASTAIIDVATGSIVFPEGVNYEAGFGLERVDVEGGKQFKLTGTVLSGSETISITNNEISLANASNYILSGANISKLTNDAGYLSSIIVSTEEPVQGEDATNQIDYPVTSIFLNYDSFQIDEIDDNIISISWKGMYVDEYLCQSITIGEGLGFDGGTISLTAAIPTGLASWNAATNSGYIRNQGFALTSELPTDVATSAYVTGLVNDLATGQVATNTSDITALKNVSGDFSNYYTKTEINTATGAIDDRLTALEQAGYITGYEAGTGIDIQDGIISCTVQGGGSELSTVFDMLSAGSNITLSKDDSTGITTIASTGGGVSNLTGLSELTNDVGFITSETNKQRVNEPLVATEQITYDPTYEIFKTTYTVSSDAISLSSVAFDDYTVANGEVATFEEWLYTADSFTTVNLDSNLVLIGALPDSFTAATYHIFVRRLVNNNGTIEQYVSFAYEVPVSE